ncbi:MAG: transglutaminase family protein [Oscillospiraceae bacterium]|nr:transglutaminase family protein [Oscillospiraceae bacterium]
MKTVSFFFSTKLTFDDYVHDHSFALRIMPLETETQHILTSNLKISPFVTTQQTVDAFGNNVTTGYIKEEHRFLDFELKGKAEVNTEKYRTDYMPCYLYQSEYTLPDENLRTFYNELKETCRAESPSERAKYFCDVLSDMITYEKDVTSTETTASQAFALKKGVCQDFSHILISILRMDGIAARYIAGLAFCDGETHSWIEYWTGEHWEGIDPANNCPGTDDYLVISQGRDFRDCAINRGVMFGTYTKQLQLVRTVMQ